MAVFDVPFASARNGVSDELPRDTEAMPKESAINV